MRPADLPEGPPLPFFRQPITDPAPEGTTTNPPAEAEPRPGRPAEATEATPAESLPEPLSPIPASETERTGTSATRPRRWIGRGYGAGDPGQAAKVLGGLLAVVFGFAGRAVAARGRVLRQPTRDDVDDITAPLGRILVRWFDLSVLGPDLADLAEAGAAAHAYTLDGPLTEPIQMAVPNGVNE